ncbi:helix-turn-helix domain-containing protein [Pseudomonas thivervalensis]|uniref:AraC family transcriptional regulator n=1 Tax=Pseudomonas thivervalensis TaxID=86265 RepID=A0A2Z4ZMZ8_9PSED|nr:helix-turn-helix domain-containing protein [Pseudomonas thivervalensis]AXA53691.1 AraC family transcriptional regulator [Pseudomonas thivervalensis]AXA59279.1 AraC family transcriptional regulator [Pseudomonas thivervalensis]
MEVTERTSANGLQAHIRGERLATSDGVSSKEILVEIFVRERNEAHIVVPAVAEPLLVWVLSGEAIVEERAAHGEWEANTVRRADFFLTTSPDPYEMRWQVTSPEPFVVMHVYLGLALLERAIAEAGGSGAIQLREVSGGRDDVLSALLEQIRAELTRRGGTSALLIQGVGQCVAVHLARHYVDAGAEDMSRRNALPAFKLKRVIGLMEQHLAEPFRLADLAQAIDLSEYHFSRQFKRATGRSPSQYFIQLRMARARKLLMETERSVIDIGLEVGYGSASHFSQIFRREVGVAPSHYRK